MTRLVTLRGGLPLGWEKMIGSGVIPATVESALLELVRTAEARSSRRSRS